MKTKLKIYIAISFLFTIIFLINSQQKTVGLMILNKDKAYDGYTLFAGKHHGLTVLIDNEGYVINSWMSYYEPGQSAYMLENGNMIRAALVKNKYNIGGGEGGRFEEFNWEGKIVWSMDYASNNYMSHHDFAPMKNGNFLAMCVEKKSREEAIEAGFKPSQLEEDSVCPEYIIEVKKIGSDKYEIVWEWHIWDHLVQNVDKSKPNYGIPSEHPEKLDVNALNKKIRAFWNHGNSIKYNEELDQIMLSIRGTSELWVIDHSTTTKEAKGSTGGKYGKGGDILYRWGNPEAYSRGNANDRQLYQQHDAQWITEANGKGNILIFNNGIDRPQDKYSSILEITSPADSKGNYPLLKSGEIFGPKNPFWEYKAKNPRDFYSAEISGVQRLPNGNTLICEGIPGHFFEITPQNEIVWSYINPIEVNRVLKQGETATIDRRGHPNNAIFKIHKYPKDFPGFKGKDLSRKNKLVE